MSSTAIGLILAGIVVLALFAASVRVLREYERGVVFRLGRVIGAKGPGLFFLIPVIDRMVRVSLRTVTREIPKQDVITRDNVTVNVNAVTYFNVVDAVLSVVAIEDFLAGTSQIAQTTLRSVVGQVDLDDLLTRRDDINQRLQHVWTRSPARGGSRSPWSRSRRLSCPTPCAVPSPSRRRPNASGGPR
jgi:regulator of protease activity HflC (stomatin/prohibitin superfamily)